MKDLISKTSVCEIISDILPMDGERVVEVETIYKAYDEILKLPEEEKRKKGKWEKAYLDHEAFGVRPLSRYCSVCNATTVFAYNYCPNCGADMRGGDDERT